MGLEVVAKCECGVEASIRIGGGMVDLGTINLFPCLCESCHSIVEVDLFSEPRHCPKCQVPNPTPYDDPRLQDTPGKPLFFEWAVEGFWGGDFTFTLNDGRYRCPQCGNMSLRFYEGNRHWD